jgi:hypothetical protein
MYPRFRRMASRLLPLALGGTLLLSIGPAAFKTVARTSLMLAEISLELCQMGLAVLRILGI